MTIRKLSLRELTQLVELGDAAAVSAVLAEHPEAAARLLGFEVSPGAPALTNAQLDPLRRRCAEARRQDRVRLERAREERALAAVQQLGATARLGHGVVGLEVGVLLGELLSHPTAKHIRFELPGGHRVSLRMRTLRELRRRVRFPDLTAHVDAHGLHLRWRDGAGGLSFLNVIVQKDDENRTLHVNLSEPSRGSRTQSVADREKPGVRVTRKGGAWLRDVLAELGFL